MDTNMDDEKLSNIGDGPLDLDGASPRPEGGHQDSAEGPPGIEGGQDSEEGLLEPVEAEGDLMEQARSDTGSVRLDETANNGTNEEMEAEQGGMDGSQLDESERAAAAATECGVEADGNEGETTGADEVNNYESQEAGDDGLAETRGLEGSVHGGQGGEGEGGEELGVGEDEGGEQFEGEVGEELNGGEGMETSETENEGVIVDDGDLDPELARLESDAAPLEEGLGGEGRLSGEGGLREEEGEGGEERGPERGEAENPVAILSPQASLEVEGVLPHGFPLVPGSPLHPGSPLAAEVKSSSRTPEVEGSGLSGGEDGPPGGEDGPPREEGDVPSHRTHAHPTRSLTVTPGAEKGEGHATPVEGAESPSAAESEGGRGRLNRQELLEQYRGVLAERQQMQEKNHALQHRLADALRSKVAAAAQRDEHLLQDERSTAEHEQRYLKYMAALDDLRRVSRDSGESYCAQTAELQIECAGRQVAVEEESAALTELKRDIALSALSTRTGKPLTAQEVERYLDAEQRKEAEVAAARLEYIKLKNGLRKEESQLRSKEELAEGLHMIDFEQLKIENQTYNEKIEERKEELVRLRKKITTTVEVLTHVKEKLQCVETRNVADRALLQQVDQLAARKRDCVSRIKQVRDSLRVDTQRMRQSAGLLGHTPLLADHEARWEESGRLETELARLQQHYAELSAALRATSSKVSLARRDTLTA